MDSSKIKCKNCNKIFIKEKYNKIFCCRECQKEYTYKQLTIYCCEICGFNKLVEAHHIIKRIDYGSDDFENLIFLCPNHHKMADSFRYKDEMKKLIFQKTGKVGKKLSEEEIFEVNKEIASFSSTNNPLSFDFHLSKRFVLGQNYSARMMATKKYKEYKNLVKDKQSTTTPHMEVKV